MGRGAEKKEKEGEKSAGAESAPLLHSFHANGRKPGYVARNLSRGDPARLSPVLHEN